MRGIDSDRGSRSPELFLLNDGAVSTLLKELTQQRLSGYYFLPSVYDSEDDLGYVVLLREVKHLSRSAAAAIAAGIDRTEVSDRNGSLDLDFGIESFAMPIGEISSPAIEHILQTFAQLFGRIGLDDLSTDFLHAIWSRRPVLGRKA